MPAPADSASADVRLFRLAWVILVIQGCFSLWALTRGWSAPLIDQHEYRQAQTALSAFWMLRDNFSFAYPLPLFGPPWSAPMEFPSYQALVAAWAGLTGSSIETAGRSISVLMLALTLPAIWLLGRVVGWSRPSRILTMALVLSAPVYLFYGRVILIETTALCAAVWFLALFAAALEKPSVGRIAIATGLAILAGLTKATTFIVFLLPAALLVTHRWRAARPSPAFLAAALLPTTSALAVVAAWVAWSDSVKRTNPFAEYLVSSAMTGWNWGTPAQRISGEFWARLWRHTTEGVVAVPALVVVALLFTLVPTVVRRQAVGLIMAYVGCVLVFSNLYFIHDYYYCANGVVLLGAMGLILGAAWESATVPRAAKIVATLILFGAQGWTYDGSYGHHFKHDPVNPPPMAGVIRESTDPEDVVVYYGADWGALIPYYSERRAIMIVGAHEGNLPGLDRVLKALPPRRVAAMYVAGPLLVHKDFIRDRVARLGLAAIPVVGSQNELLFLRNDLIAAAHERLSRNLPAGLSLDLSATGVDASLVRQEFAPQDLPMLLPTPMDIRGKFPLGVMQYEGALVLSAHAPAELRFQPPAGTRRITIETGLSTGAYEAGPDSTDGVDIVITAALPGGPHRELFRRTLRPVENISDRGTQRLQFEHDAPFTSDIVITVTPGPADRIARDWTYFKRIEFQ
jgi:hypothetical protein